MEVVTPLHVSGIWVPHYSENALETGSIGAGLNLAIYLRAQGSLGACRIYLNGIAVLEEQAKTVCDEAGISVETKAYSAMPLGRGFGVSAGLLASHALITYLYANRPSIKALQRAHVLEVHYRTGLGDVIAEYTGGFALRLRPGAPGVGLAYRVIPRERVHLVVADLGISESTSSMLSRINFEKYKVGIALLSEVIEKEDISLFFDYSRRFTSTIFNYDMINRIVEGLRGVIGFYLKKSALVMWAEREYIHEIISLLREKKSIKALYTTISPIGVTLVRATQSPEKDESTHKGKNRGGL